MRGSEGLAVLATWTGPILGCDCNIVARGPAHASYTSGYRYLWCVVPRGTFRYQQEYIAESYSWAGSLLRNGGIVPTSTDIIHASQALLSSTVEVQPCMRASRQKTVVLV